MDEKRVEKSKKHKKLSKKAKIFIGIGSVVLLLIAIALGGTWYVASRVNNVEIDRKDVVDGNKVETKDDIINVAFFGTDNADTGADAEKGMCDSIMIATINNTKKEIKLTSILRDTWVYIPDHGENNINMAMMDGGPQLMLKTINRAFKLDVDKFVQVNLNSLPKIIDKLGGVEIDIDSDELNIINGYISSVDKLNGTKTKGLTKTGKQTLNGTQAVAYCRIRYTEGRDFKRTDRQREVIEQVANKARNLTASELPGFIMEFLPLINTNMTTFEMIDIGTSALGLKDAKIQEARFPLMEDTRSETVNNWYRLYYDEEKTIDLMHKFIYSN